jgi:hypothetical protein
MPTLPSNALTAVQRRQKVSIYENSRLWVWIRSRQRLDAINILKLALSTVGHTGTWVKDPNASGDSTSTLVGPIQSPASWVYERRIPSPLGMGVSNECYSATSASASASGASGTSCLIVK